MEKETHEYLVTKLVNYAETHNTSLNKIALSIPVSQTTLNLWRNNRYKGNNANIDELVSGFLSRQAEADKMDYSLITFQKITAAQIFFDVAKDLHQSGQLGVIYGPAGTGKTYSAKEYARINKDTILLEVDLSYTNKVTIREIHKACGLDGVGSLHDMFEQIIDKLKDTKRFLIVDEAEYLPHRSLEIIRRINDRAGIGIMLVGLPRLVYNLRGYKGEFAQLYSRASLVKKLPELSKEDTEMIVKSVFPNSNGVWKTFHKQSNCNGRALEKLIIRSRSVSELNEMPVNDEIVNQVSKLLIK